MTDDDSSSFDRSEDAPPGGSTDVESSPDADADASTDAETWGNANVPADAQDQPAVDEDLQDVVEYDLADLAEEAEEDDFPSMDDPIDPQSIDVENAAFVVLGVLAMVALVLHLVLGTF